MKLYWKKMFGSQNFSAVLRDGSRYTIDRLGSSWSVSYLPTGNAEGGRTAVPWLPGLRSLTLAKESCLEHSQALDIEHIDGTKV